MIGLILGWAMRVLLCRNRAGLSLFHMLRTKIWVVLGRGIVEYRYHHLVEVNLYFEKIKRYSRLMSIRLAEQDLMRKGVCIKSHVRRERKR